MRTLNLLAIGLAVFASNSLIAAEDCTGNCVATVVTDFSGKPPFKRRVEMLPVVEVAEVEIVTSDPVWVDVKTVDFKGKPPFKRRVERLEQTEVLEVEVVDEPESSAKGPRKTTGNSIFKRH
ncbi:MAG: hypothetical protein WDZ52_12745 [Pseudohongiellaceae bacterium]